MSKLATGKKTTKGKAAKPAPATASPQRPGMTVDQALAELEALGDPKVRAQNSKSGAWGAGAGSNQYGVPLGEIRALAKKIKAGHDLALALWDTGNVDAQFLAALLLQPKQLSPRELDRLVRSISYVRVADWLISYVVANFPEKETLREGWMNDKNRWAARAGWQLTASRVAKSPEGLNLVALLDRIEKEMPRAEPEVQWTMNNTLAAIGIHEPKLRKRALAIGEKIGLYRDWPVSKGCTPPYAPVWINFMVQRQG